MDEPILTNDDMKKIRDGFNQSRLPEQMFSKVVGWVKDKVEKGVMKVDEAVKTVMGWDSDALANEIKTGLYNLQYRSEAQVGGWYAKPEMKRDDYATGGESFATTDQQFGKAADDKPIDFTNYDENDYSEEARKQALAWVKKDLEVPTLEYNPSKFDPPDRKYYMTVLMLQNHLTDLGYLPEERWKYDEGKFDEMTFQAVQRFLRDHNIKRPKGKERVVDQELFEKIQKEAWGY